LSQNDKNKQNRSQLNSRAEFILAHLRQLWHPPLCLSWSAQTRRISRALSTQSLGEVDFRWGNWCLVLPLVCHQTFPWFVFFPSPATQRQFECL